MGLRLKLKQWEIDLLEWELQHPQEDSVHVSRVRKYTSTGWGPEAYADYQRHRARKKLAQRQRALAQRLAYLKRHHYLESVREAEQTLNKLTARGKFEILRLRFVLHMRQQRQKKRERKFYLVVFDIPETKRIYRDFFRKLLKQNGFRLLQLSVWITRDDPRPVIDHLLRFLKVDSFFELMEIDCAGCSARLKKRMS